MRDFSFVAEFVGRRDELAFLHDELSIASTGKTRCITIEGEAGLGKSRLIAEFVLQAGTRAAASTGICSEFVQIPYLPFTEILDRLGGRRPWRTMQHRRSEFFMSVADILKRRAARGPVILVIEDLQWADAATLELLAFLLARLSNAAIVFLLAIRDTRPEQPALATFRGALARHRCASLVLRPLRQNDVRRLIQTSMERRSVELPVETIAQIESLSDGNPLFAEELARLALENGELHFESHVPLSVNAILSERLAPFDEADRGVLVRAAIIGESFDVPLLSAILETAQERILELLQRCVERGLLLEDEHQPLRFAFRHSLIRRALADRLVFALAAPLHTRVAQALESQNGAELRPAEIAYHWSAARASSKARYWNERAAEQAWELYAYRDAIRFYGEALRFDYPPGPQRARIYESIGRLYYIEGYGEEPARWYAKSRDEYESIGDAPNAARALWLLADQRWVDARTRDGLKEAQEALAAARSLDLKDLENDAILSVVRARTTLGHAAEALAEVENFRQCAYASPEMRACMGEVRGEALAILGSTRSALHDLNDACDAARESGDAELIAQIENNAALSLCDLGEYDAALTRHREALREAERTGMLWRVAYCSLNYAHTLTIKGELRAARDAVWTALDTGVRTATAKTKAASVGIPIALMLNDSALLQACADEEAIALATRSSEVQRIVSVNTAFAALRLEQGASGEASALLRHALSAFGPVHRSWAFFLAAALQLHGADLERARALLAAAPGRARIRRAYRLLFEAIAAAPVSEQSRAAALAAARQFRLLGDVLHETLALEYSGDTAAALARYEALGNVRDAARLAKPAAAPGRLDLTPRQMQIAALVARGKTNRSIAVELNISEHTVEHHVSGIFERLGLRSRAQLAGIVAQLATTA